MRESTLRELTLRLKNAAPTLQLEENADMARYTTLHLGGPADLMANPDDPAQIPLLIETARELDVPVTVIGNGSNLLVRSGGIRGLVIRICRNLRGVEVNGDRIRAQAGTMMSSLSMAAADCDLGGLTFASGIPGTIGGGVYMNAGAYGGEMSQVVTLVEGYNMAGEPFRYSRPDLHFGYRFSRLMKENKIITHVTVQLPPGQHEELLAEMVDFNRRRAEKQQLRVCQKRPEVNHRADADKQQQREKLIRHACIKQCIQHLDRARVRQVAQDAAKAHRQQQRRLHLLADCEINHHAADCPHDNHLHRQLTQIAQNG